MEKQTIGWMFMLSGKNGIVRVKVNFDDRFKDDKFYCDNEKITIVSDGVILNKSELFAKYKVTTLEDLLFLLLKNRHKAQRKAKFYINKCRSASCMQGELKQASA